MKVWIVQYDDTDFYCEGMHLVGVYTTVEKAKEAAKEHKEKFPIWWMDRTFQAVDVDTMLEPE